MRLLSLISTFIVLSSFSVNAEAKIKPAKEICKEYKRTVFINGKEQKEVGTTCLQNGKDWVIYDEKFDNDERIKNRNKRVSKLKEKSRNNSIIADSDIIYHDRHRDIYRYNPFFSYGINSSRYKNKHYRNRHFSNRYYGSRY